MFSIVSRLNVSSSIAGATWEDAPLRHRGSKAYDYNMLPALPVHSLLPVFGYDMASQFPASVTMHSLLVA